VPQNRLHTIQELIQKSGEPSYRFKQVCEAIFKRPLTKYSEISNIPKNLRTQIIEKLGDDILTLTVVSKQEDSQVGKYLFETVDGEHIEAVFMRHQAEKGRFQEHTSLCSSTQIGCTMGCKFCTTGTVVGFKRNLSADEIADQILYFPKQNIPVHSVFFGAMGEPLANPNFFTALDQLTNPDYLGMGARRLTVSTVGIVPGIEKLTKEFPQVNIAFSLHSPFEKQRSELMPANDLCSLTEVMEALDKHIAETNRRVFLAYVMLKDLNDSAKHAQALVKLIKSRGKKWYLYHVNLIRFNEGSTRRKYTSSSNKAIELFKGIIEKAGIGCTVRMNFGADIDAACGQLYAGYGK
jgi:23S rRNA (adenine-C8)-methyltransferase